MIRSVIVNVVNANRFNERNATPTVLDNVRNRINSIMDRRPRRHAIVIREKHRK